MKTFVILSDSHGRKRAVEKLRPLFAENDYIIHLGDGSFDLRETFSEYPDKTYIIKGNCDAAYGEDECVIEAEGISLFCCHGHRYGVKTGLTRLAARAKELGCEVALYGHTHRAEVQEVDGVLCINPGSAGSYSDPSYCYLVLHDKKITPTLVSLV
ncbi:MAG: metallophosphoesterase [Clostridia bacterium]|nr:metallophosphoesterase [Clostridia bacterium]